MVIIGILEDQDVERGLWREMLENAAEKNGVNIIIKEYSSSDQLIFDDEYMLIDVLYVDIMLGDDNGYEMTRRLRKEGFNGEIVFYSRREDYVFQAFDVDAMHFIRKGKISERQFEEIFLKGYERFNAKNQELIILKNKSEVVKVPILNVYYFEVNNRIVTAHYKEGKFDFYTTLGKLEEMLKGKGFCRCHKSYLVSKSAVVSIDMKDPKKLRLINGDEIGLGRKYVEEFI